MPRKKRDPNEKIEITDAQKATALGPNTLKHQNTAPWKEAEMPAANGQGSAQGLAKFYSLVVPKDKNLQILNDETIKILCEQAIVQAKAGCDIIAPSDMMDGRVKDISTALDNHNFINTLILAYSSKYASSFYGPFRNAVGSKINQSKISKKS